MVGYGDLGDQAKDGSVLWLDVRGEASAEVHAELERRALERRSPDGVVRAVADESDDVLRAILEERGYELIRSSYRMGIDVDGATFSPALAGRRRSADGSRGGGRALAARAQRALVRRPLGPYTDAVRGVAAPGSASMGVGDPSLWFIVEVDGAPAGVAICRPFDHGDPDCGWVVGARRPPRAPQDRPRHGAADTRARRVPAARAAPGRSRGRRREHDRGGRALRASGDARPLALGHLGAPAVSALRARCPHCRTLTAVAFDDGYECHSCGAAFAAGLVRVPRAWGVGRRGDGGSGAARTFRSPEALVVERSSLEEQSDEIARGLPRRPLVLGGCCCAHVGAIRGLAGRHDRLAVVWLDAHGDLNTPETSPSGNLWGMPLRMAIDEGSVRHDERRARRCARPRPARGGVRRRARDRRRSRPCARRRRRPSTSRSTSTCSSRGPCPASCRCRAASAWRRSRRSSARSPPGHPIAGLGLTGLAPGADPGDAGATRRRGRALTDRH